MKIQSVDEYINGIPEEYREKLMTLRLIIKESAPHAEEKISYGMPYYGYKGRLAYFAYTKNHIGLYIPPPVIENHKNDLKNFQTAKATIQFPHDKKLPVGLIRKLIKERVKLNEMSKK